MLRRRPPSPAAARPAAPPAGRQSIPTPRRRRGSSAAAASTSRRCGRWRRRRVRSRFRLHVLQETGRPVPADLRAAETWLCPACEPSSTTPRPSRSSSCTPWSTSRSASSAPIQFGRLYLRYSTASLSADREVDAVIRERARRYTAPGLAPGTGPGTGHLPAGRSRSVGPAVQRADGRLPGRRPRGHVRRPRVPERYPLDETHSLVEAAFDGVDARSIWIDDDQERTVLDLLRLGSTPTPMASTSTWSAPISRPPTSPTGGRLARCSTTRSRARRPRGHPHWRTREAVLAWWGIVLAGAVAVPVNTAYKGEYLRH